MNKQLRKSGPGKRGTMTTPRKTYTPKRRNFQPLQVEYIFSITDYLLTQFSTISAVEPKKKIYSHHKVRTSLRDRTLDSMFPITNQAQIETSSPKSSEGMPINTLSRSREIKESQCLLTSVKNLRQNIIKGRHRRGLISQLL